VLGFLGKDIGPTQGLYRSNKQEIEQKYTQVFSNIEMHSLDFKVVGICTIQPERAL
jgi:hypothetical protein